MLQIGESGKSTRELEKTIALLKKVIERTQMENEQLKRGSQMLGSEQYQALKDENQGLKVSLFTVILHVTSKSAVPICRDSQPIVVKWLKQCANQVV